MNVTGPVLSGYIPEEEREGERKGWRERGREGGREQEMEGETEGGREGWKERERDGRREGRGRTRRHGSLSPWQQTPPTGSSLRAILQHEVASSIDEGDMLGSHYASILHEVWAEGGQHVTHGPVFLRYVVRRAVLKVF